RLRVMRPNVAWALPTVPRSWWAMPTLRNPSSQQFHHHSSILTPIKTFERRQFQHILYIMPKDQNAVGTQMLRQPVRKPLQFLRLLAQEPIGGTEKNQIRPIRSIRRHRPIKPPKQVAGDHFAAALRVDRLDVLSQPLQCRAISLEKSYRRR